MDSIGAGSPGGTGGLITFIISPKSVSKSILRLLSAMIPFQIANSLVQWKFSGSVNYPHGIFDRLGSAAKAKALGALW